MDKNIATKFNLCAEKYDMQREQLIPLMNLFYKTATQMVSLKSEGGKILDLGAGTGLFTKWVIEKYPKAQYTLLDIAEDMLCIAKERFKGYNNVQFKVQDYRNEVFSEKYESIISSLSIHHLDTNEKLNLFKNIYESLEDNGVFVNADQVKGEDEESEKIVKDYHLSIIDNSSLSIFEKKKTYDRMKLDKMDTMSTQLDIIKSIGFNSVDVYYKYYNFVVFMAKK